MYKIFLFIIFVFFSNTTYANLTQEVTLKDGTTVTVGGAHQDQLNDWVNNAQNAQSYDQLAQDMYNGGIGHADVHVSDTGVACDNGASLQIVNNNEGSSSNTSSTGGGGTSTLPPPPPAPQPTTTTSTTNGGSCSSYISSWSPSWSSCEIQGTWSTNGNINCKQTNNWSPNTSSCGTLVTTTTTTCVGTDCTSNSSSSCKTSSCPGNTPRPSTQTDTKTISMGLSNTITDTKGSFANNLDTNDVTVKISGTTNQNKDIVSWGTSGVFSNFTDTSGIPSNMIYNTGRALNFESVPNNINIQKINGQNFDFTITNIKSKTPMLRSDGKITFKAGGTTMELQGIDYEYKKPFTGYIEVKNPYTGTWDGKTSLGTQMEYKLSLLGESTLDKNLLSNYSLNDFGTEIEEYGTGIYVQNVSLSGSTLTDTNGTIFTARVNSSTGATELNQNPGIQVNLPVVKYNLAGNEVGYYLSKENGGDDDTPINSEGEKFKGVKILGNLQGGGKQEFTGQETNFSDILGMGIRGQIRESAYTHISSMNSGDVVDGVKYVRGDYEISGDLGYETLVVEDGNVIITGDLNPSGNKLGIISLKDNYDVFQDYANAGNIYVKPGVKNINASIYADGGFISVGNDGAPFATDNTQRTYTLKNQLYMKGTLSTRNTIGGSVLVGGMYVLPGGKYSDDFDLAMQYDLNYIRRGSIGWDTNNNGVLDNGEYDDAFIIEYNSNIQLDPPKLFAN